jgi:hypothetical protein
MKLLQLGSSLHVVWNLKFFLQVPFTDCLTNLQLKKGSVTILAYQVMALGEKSSCLPGKDWFV